MNVMLEELAKYLLRQLQHPVIDAGDADISFGIVGATRIEDEDHPVIGVELANGEEFFVEVTLP